MKVLNDGRIERHPSVLGGTLVVSGTRIPVSLIQNLVAHGYDVHRVVRAYPSLTPEDVAAALAFVSERVDRRQSGPSVSGE
jgi:uncharacterized protein (DUF433 family)